MTKFVLVFSVLLGFAMESMAGEWSGYIADSRCAKGTGASTLASAAHAECAKRCIKKGDKAILITNDGKIYQIANQEKVIDNVGLKVTIQGQLDGDSVKVTKVTLEP